MSRGSGIGKEILFGALAKCNQELDPRERSELIARQGSASIGKTYRGIFKTFERHK
jgi:hypothetical protein